MICLLWIPSSLKAEDCYKHKHGLEECLKYSEALKNELEIYQNKSTEAESVAAQYGQMSDDRTLGLPPMAWAVIGVVLGFTVGVVVGKSVR